MSDFIQRSKNNKIKKFFNKYLPYSSPLNLNKALITNLNRQKHENIPNYDLSKEKEIEDTIVLNSYEIFSTSADIEDTDDLNSEFKESLSINDDYEKSHSIRETYLNNLKLDQYQLDRFDRMIYRLSGKLILFGLYFNR